MLCWDSTLEGERTDAVFVEGYELGRPAGVLLAGRYERHCGGVSRVEVPLLREEPEPLVPPMESRRTHPIAAHRDLSASLGSPES